jgi:hypothetical protein
MIWLEITKKIENKELKITVGKKNNTKYVK